MLQRTFTRFFLWGQAKFIQQHFVPFSSSSSPCPSAWLDGSLRQRYPAPYTTTTSPTAEPTTGDSVSALSEKVDQWSRRQLAPSSSSSSSSSVPLLPSFVFPSAEAVGRRAPRPPVLRSPVVVVDRNEGTPLLSVLPWSPDELELWWMKEDQEWGKKRKRFLSSEENKKDQKDDGTELLDYVDRWETSLSLLRRVLLSPPESFMEEEKEKGKGVERKNTDKDANSGHNNTNNNSNNNNNNTNKEEMENTKQNTNAAVMCAAESLQSGIPFSFLYHQKLIHETVHLSLDSSIDLLQQMKQELLHSAHHKDASAPPPLLTLLETSRWGEAIQRVLLQREKDSFSSLDTRREDTVTTFLVCPGLCYGLSDGLQDVILAVLTGLWILLSSSPSSSTIRIMWRPHEKNCLGVMKLMEVLDRYSRKPETLLQQHHCEEASPQPTVLFPFHILLTANLTDQLIGPLLHYAHVRQQFTTTTTAMHRPCHVVHLLTSRLSSAETNGIECYCEKSIKDFHTFSPSPPIHKLFSEESVFFFYVFITALKVYRPQMVSLYLTSPPAVELECSGSGNHLTKKDPPPQAPPSAAASATLETVLEDILQHAFFPYGTSATPLLKAHIEAGVVTHHVGASPSLTTASTANGSKSLCCLQSSDAVSLCIDRHYEEGESAVVALRMVVPHHHRCNPLEEEKSLTAASQHQPHSSNKKTFEMSVLRYVKHYLQTRYIPFLQHSLSPSSAPSSSAAAVITTTASKGTLSTAVLPDEWERIETQIKAITSPPRGKKSTHAEAMPSRTVLSFQHLLGGFLLPSKRGLYPLPCVCCAVNRPKKEKAAAAAGEESTITSTIDREAWGEVGKELENTLPIIRGRLLLIAFEYDVVYEEEEEEEEGKNNNIKIGRRNCRTKVVTPLGSKDELQGSEKGMNPWQLLDYYVCTTDDLK